MLWKSSSETADVIPDILLRLTGSFLNAADDFLFFSFFEQEIIIGELSVFLFEAAFDLVPGAFHAEFSHNVRGWVGLVWVG